MGWSLWLCLLYFLILLSPSLSTSRSPSFSNSSMLCHSDESNALLSFKNSLSINNTGFFSDSEYCDYSDDFEASNTKTLTWKNGTDCCTWRGVKCDKATGNVIKLDLHCSALEGIIHPNNSLFFLRHLRRLDISYNYFKGSQISAQFGRFTSMEHLNLSFSVFTGQVPPELSYQSKLLTLDLSFNDLLLETLSLQRISRNLTNLKKLLLCQTDTSFAEPHSLMNLSSSLTHLDLSFSDLQRKFPENIFRLPNLQVLDLSFNQNLTGSLPKSNWSSPIRELALSGTQFPIDLPYLVSSLKSLNQLHLSKCKCIGSYPALVANLTTLTTSLDLSVNNFSGQIPWLSLNFERLTYLDLSGNRLIGELPQTSSHIPFNLTYLSLYDNNLTGTIPSWLYSLPVLKTLDLSHNQFIGSIQEFRYASLSYLSFGSNKLHSIIPTSIFQQEDLTYLDLSRNNLSGSVGLDQFSKLKNLENLYLSFYNLSLSSDDHNYTNYSLPELIELELSSCNLSEFPYFLRFSEGLEHLDLSNNKIQGGIPKWLWNVGKDSLYVLILSHNHLTDVGKLPWKHLNLLDLRSNSIHGRLPIPPPSTSYYFISNNQLTGEIPSSICSLTSIEVIQLSYNNLNGSIPLCLGNLSRLSVLDLRMNMFDGTIPATFGNGKSLTTINLNGNRFEGALPRGLRNCTNLKILDLGCNMINDTFPQWLKSLPMLQILILKSNKFHGSIGSPNVTFSFGKLRIIDLSNNQFNGFLPTKYFENFLAMMHDSPVDKLEYMGDDVYFSAYYQDSVVVTIKGLGLELERIQILFTTIDFSRNNFEGDIPKTIGNLKSLKGLNLSHNNISGHISPSLAKLTNLEWLDLSSNQLYGNIPGELVQLTTLEVLNVSQNQLVGAIPSGNQFNSFDNNSYIGNVGLCGFPLSKTCDHDGAEQPSPSVIDEEATNGIVWNWKFVLMGYGCGLVIGISVGYMFFSDKRFDCFMKKIGGESWLKLLKRKKQYASFRNRRRNYFSV
ncbi:hypothetical protein FNV43_RR25427 [Rhamnella rubrinervis]|uniref:Leucine-rich repeat-containing N-terminal plant-type domain-containing protein n=1 Tax=Rhamnella rubrinervis TaxID=2594499 RepID=A0A8K0DU60_9ROSA|nr:hypothetical protein FNV43_RR25427 [Rhamnella rubrinervis]